MSSRIITGFSSNLLSRLLSPNALVLRHEAIAQSSGYRFLSNYARMKNYYAHTRKYSVYNNSVQPGAPLPSQPPSFSRWILGILVTITLPFAGNKLGPLLQFKNEIDSTVDTIEEIVEVVEKAAELVEKVAEGISDDIPNGGEVKKMVDMVEDVAEQTAKDAHAVGDAIDKFQEVEEKVENIIGALSDDHHKEAKNEK